MTPIAQRILIYGFATAIMLFLLIVIDGQTFGQRAARQYPWGSLEWTQEVDRLAKGEK